MRLERLRCIEEALMKNKQRIKTLWLFYSPAHTSKQPRPLIWTNTTISHLSVRAGCYGNSVGVDSYLKWSPSASTVSICIPPIRLKTIALWPPSTAHRRPTQTETVSTELTEPEAPTQEHKPRTQTCSLLCEHHNIAADTSARYTEIKTNFWHLHLVQRWTFTLTWPKFNISNSPTWE